MNATVLRRPSRFKSHPFTTGESYIIAAGKNISLGLMFYSHEHRHFCMHAHISVAVTLENKLRGSVFK